MPKAAPFLASSNSGEFSPRMDARVDFDKYLSAISRGLNLLCLPQGGLTLRPGTRFINDVGSNVGALFPFAPVTDRAYMLHLFGNTLAIYRNQAQLTAPAAGGNVNNGTFNANSVGWSNNSTGTATVAWSADFGGTLKLTGVSNGVAWAEQAVPVTINTTQVFRFQLRGNYGSKVTVQVGGSTTSFNLFLGKQMGMGWHTVGINSAITPVYFQVKNEQEDVVYLDDVELLTAAPITLTTPYSTDEQVQGLRTAQTADVLYFFHDDFAIYKLERRGDTNWSFVKVFIEDGPWGEINPETDLSATNLVKNSRFENGTTDWVLGRTGVGAVRWLPDERVVQFFFTAGGAGEGSIYQAITTTAPNVSHVIHFQVFGDSNVLVKISAVAPGNSELYNQDLDPGWYSLEITPTASPFYLHFSEASGNTSITTGVTAAFVYTHNARLLEPGGTTGTITVNAQGNFSPFVASDVGRLLRFEYPGAEPGWGIITAFADAQSVTLRVYRTLVRTAPLETWRFGTWSDTTGWPHVGVFYQQRLMCARNETRPQTVWGSQTADFENFRPDSYVAGAPAIEDNDGLNFTIAADKVTPIMWMAGSRRLVVGTGSGQWLIVSSSNKAAITPNDFSADPQTSVAALDIAPVQIDNVVLFAQKAKRTIFDLGFAAEADSFRAADVTILSDHITRGNVAQIIYQAEPFSNVWVRLESGTLAVLTYKRGQNVVGWTPVEIAGTDCLVQQIGVIPGDDADDNQVYSSINRDEVWMIVSRTIDGNDVNYIEVMEGFFDGPNRAGYLDKEEWRDAVRAAQVDAFYLDSGLTYQGPETGTVSGLGHLEGETVAIIGDGASRDPQVVTAGAVTLDPPASTIHVGLPYPWVYRTLKLPYGSATGPGVGQAKTVSGLVIVLRDSGALQYAIELSGEGESEAQLQWFDVPIRTTSDEMGVAVPLFSGEVEHNPGGGYASDPRVLMRGLADGMPFTLLGIVPKVAESEL